MSCDATSVQFENKYYWDKYWKLHMNISYPVIPIIDRNDYPCNNLATIYYIECMNMDIVKIFLFLIALSENQCDNKGNDIMNVFVFFDYAMYGVKVTGKNVFMLGIAPPAGEHV